MLRESPLLKKTALLLATVLTSATTIAAEFPLPIRLIDSATGSRVDGADVEAVSSDGGTRQHFNTTDLARGIRLPEGSYSVKITAPDFKPFAAQVAVHASSPRIQVQLDRLQDPEEIRLDRIAQLRRADSTVMLGYVVDEETGLPLESVEVSSRQGRAKSVTNDRGFFQLWVQAPRDSVATELLFQKSGYTTEERQNIEVWPGGDVVLQARLVKGKGKNVVVENPRRQKVTAPVTRETTAPIVSQTTQLASAARPAEDITSFASGTPTNLTVRVPTNIRVLLTNGTVEYVSLETYVERSLNQEWYSSWGSYSGGTNSLKAGAVAIRSYASSYVDNPSSTYDICATTSCQVYGTTWTSNTRAAAQQTAGYVLLNSSHNISRSEYSAENNSLGFSCGDGFTQPTGGCISDPVCSGETRFGHGRGLCQWGSAKWATGLKIANNGGSYPANANSGLTNGQPKQNWVWIVEHYYPTLRLVQGLALVIGDDIQASSSVSVRQCADGGIASGTGCTLITTKAAGSTGTIIDGPVRVTSDGSGYTWWKIEWSDATVGWSVENYIQRDIPTPTAPSGFSATAVSDTQINLSWTDLATTEVGYKVERSLVSGGPFTEIVELTTNTTSYVDTDLSPTTTYYYRVWAFNLGGNSTKRSDNATTFDVPPTLDPISNKTVAEGSTLTFTAIGAAADWVTPVTDFESYSAGAEVMFQEPSFSGSTGAMLDASPNTALVTAGFPSGSGLGARTLNASWSWNATANPWLRLTTGGGLANLPSPVIDFNKQLRFDIRTDKSLKVAVGCRETTTASGTDIGSDGGTTGSIEWAGVTGVSGNAPVCTRTIAANTWTTVTFDFATEAIRNFFTGNGVLSTASGLGTLEHIAFVPNAGTGTYNVYLDNFSVVQPKTLTYSLDAGFPTGASINPTTGVFTWTPTTGQGPTNYTITVRVTDNGTPIQSATQTFTVTVTAPPRFNSQPQSQTVTQGANVTFTVSATGTATLNYQWRLNGNAIANATGTSFTRLNAQSSDAGNYSVVITNALGTITSSNAVLTVNVPPSITAQPQGQTVIEGSTANFSVTAAGTAPLAYQWKKGASTVSNGGKISGATSSSLTVTDASPAEAGSYSVVITNVAGTVQSSTATLTVNVPPSISSQPQSISVTQSSNAVFTVIANGTAPLSYQWKKDGAALMNGANISGATSAALTVANTITNDAGNYSVTVTNVAGTITSDAAVLVVNVPPAFLSQPENQTVVEGNPVTFSVEATGTAPLAYQWLFDGNAIASATSSSYTIATAESTNTGTYSVVVSNVAGTATSASASLTVNPFAIAPVISQQPTNVFANAGSSPTFSVIATGNPLHYQWLYNSNQILGATASSYTRVNAQTFHAGNYSVIISNAAGVVVSSNATLTVNTDFISPTLKVSTPLAGQRLIENVTATNYLTRLSGTASDAVSLSQVRYSVNGGPWIVATGTTNWSAIITVQAGLNTVIVKAVDNGLNEATVSRSFTYVVMSPITVQKIGPGTISSNWTTSTLEIGKNYKLTATVGAGTNYIFTNWTRVVAGSTNHYSLTNILTFTMQSNLVLQGNFITNPFVRLAGGYNGLFYQTNGVSHESAGFCNILVMKGRTYTGKLLVDGDSVSISGKFTLEGTASNLVSRELFAKSPLTLELAIDMAGSSDQITGTVKNGGLWNAELLADRATWTTNNLATRYTNAYAFVLPGFTNLSEGPVGSSFGSVIVDKLGKARLTGFTADGQPANQTMSISKNGEWPLHVNNSLITNVITYRGKLRTNREYQGSLMGWVTFATNTPAGRTNLAPLGTVSWIKTGWTNALYPNGFTNVGTLISSRHAYTNTATHRVMNFTNASIILSGGTLPQPITNTVFLRTNNVFTVLATTNNIKPTLTAKTGVIGGTNENPPGTFKQPFKGILLQDYNVGYGFFTNTTVGGAVKIQPQ